jgi:putative transposase
VKLAEKWRWSSLWQREQEKGPMKQKLAEWPVKRPRDWATRVNRAQNEKELLALRQSRDRGRPYGTIEWTQRTARRLNIESALRAVGRPKKMDKGKSRVKKGL